MNNVDEFICSKANMTTDTEAVEWMSNAVQYLREQQKQLAKVPDLYDEIERQQERIAYLEQFEAERKLLNRVTELAERQRDAALEALEELHDHISEDDEGYHAYIDKQIERIRGMK